MTTPYWDQMTSAEILSDMNTVLSELVFPPESSPDWFVLPVWSYWWLKRGMIDLLLRSRKARRPKRFTRK